MAILIGTPTSSISIDGSGVITVLALKLTRLPVKLPLTLPSLPFHLSWTPFKWRPLRNCLEGSILRLELSIKLAI